MSQDETLIDYSLPERLIAQTPLEDRSASRLMVVHRQSGQIEHLLFRDCGRFLNPGDVLVLNETLVTARRLHGRRSDAGGGQVEALLLKRIERNVFEALCRPGRRLRPGAAIVFGDCLRASVEGIKETGERILRFDPIDELDAEIESASEAAVPPYIHKPPADKDRYQTVYANRSLRNGSAAAPTAGLHFTPEILQNLEAKGVTSAKVNLTVGLDTFRPISEGSVSEHVMHGETCEVSAETAAVINEAKGRIVCVGTTSVRTVETFARRALRDGERIAHGQMVSKLFLYPGIPFKLADAMFTNFHMPRTTMLLMIAAYAGRELIEEAYRQAVKEEYRFLSFGDSMLLTE